MHRVRAGHPVRDAFVVNSPWYRDQIAGYQKTLVVKLQSRLVKGRKERIRCLFLFASISMFLLRGGATEKITMQKQHLILKGFEAHNVGNFSLRMLMRTGRLGGEGEGEEVKDQHNNDSETALIRRNTKMQARGLFTVYWVVFWSFWSYFNGSNFVNCIRVRVRFIEKGFLQKRRIFRRVS